MKVFLAPHNDDETLFGAFTLLRHKPLVIVCLKSYVQEDRGGPTAAEREGETNRAMWWLGVEEWRQWNHDDRQPDWKAVEQSMQELDAELDIGEVFAPACEVRGHDHHNEVGFLAQEVFGDRLSTYLTYKRGSGKSRSSTPVSVDQSLWVILKLKAMACYESQIRLENTRPWFLDEPLREYMS